MAEAAVAQDEAYVALGARRVALALVEERGARLAAALRAWGVERDDCVAILMRNDVCVFEALVATNLLGAYAVPINWHLKQAEIRFILEDSRSAVLLVHADLLETVRDAVPAATRIVVARTPAEIADAYGLAQEVCRVPQHLQDLDEVIAAHRPLADRTLVGSRGSIVYTSGTTGRPKGVKRLPLDAQAARRFAQLAREWFDLRPGIRTVMAGPMYHSAPNTYAKAALGSGGSIVLMPKFDPQALLAAIEAHRITHVHLVPTMFVRLLRLPEQVRARYDLGSLEFVVHGAAPCPREIKRQMIEWWGPVIHEYYGATETGMVSRASSQEWLAHPGTLGKPWPNRQVRIYADDGTLLPPERVGEIFVSLDGVPQFTYHNAAAERERIDRAGLVTNGDLGYLDAQGYLYLVDRKKDMVISGGVNIYPAEIECALAEHPQVSDCAVIGVPDEEFGEKVAAFVVARDPVALSEQTLREFLRGRIANYKIPRVVRFVDDLPRDASGKLLKRQLREPFWAERTLKI